MSRAGRVQEQARRARQRREQARFARARATQERVRARITRVLAEGTRAGWTAGCSADASLTCWHPLPDAEPWPPVRMGERLPAATLALLPGLTSRIYVWGYGRPHSAALHPHGQPTPDAWCFATERGWEENRAGAWAKELALPIPLSLALAALEPVVRGDEAVIGWGGRTVRAPASSRSSSTPSPVTRPRAIGRCGVTPLPGAGQNGPLRPGETPLRERLAQWASAEVAEAKVLCMAIAARLEAARKLRSQLVETTRNLDASRPRPRLAFPTRDQESAPEMRSRPAGRPGTQELTLPDGEFNSLNEVVTHAHELAGAGCLAAGYSVLLAGEHRAEEAAAAGFAWAEALIGIYRLALENYEARYRLPL